MTPSDLKQALDEQLANIKNKHLETVQRHQGYMRRSAVAIAVAGTGFGIVLGTLLSSFGTKPWGVIAILALTTIFVGIVTLFNIKTSINSITSLVEYSYNKALRNESTFVREAGNLVADAFIASKQREQEQFPLFTSTPTKDIN